MDGGGTRVHVVDIDGARRRSHELTAQWLELGLGWQESTPGRATSLDCSGRSKERDAGRARLDRVEQRLTAERAEPDPRRAVGTNGTLIPITGAIGDNCILRW